MCHIRYRNESRLMSEDETAEQRFLWLKYELQLLLRNVTVGQFVHAEQIIEAALAQAVASNAVHVEGINSECLKDSVMIIWRGVAVHQIFGKTLHSVFSLPIEKSTAIMYQRMTGQRLEQESRKWCHGRSLMKYQWSFTIIRYLYKSSK